MDNRIGGRYSRSCTLAVAVTLVLSISSIAIAASGKVVLYYDEKSQPVVRLDRVSPMSAGLKAILAMYSLQNGAGCSGGVNNLHCALTGALGIDGQCSERHVELVRTWFKGGIPKMSGYADALYRNTAGPETLSSICYKMPDGATFQRLWDLIRVTKNGNRIIIYGHGIWSAREESGGFRYITEYEIANTEVNIISHKETSAKGDK